MKFVAKRWMSNVWENKVQRVVTDAQRIDVIQQARDKVIKELLCKANLKSYLKELQITKDNTTRRLELIKRDLEKLRTGRVDLVHYAPILMRMKKAKDKQLMPGDETLIQREVNRILSRYF